MGALHVNASEQCFLLVPDFLLKTKTTVLPHPPYSLDLAPSDFSLFPKRLEGHQFQSAEEVKSTSQAELKNISKNGFQKCFHDLYL
ncbi:hypothetical protein TNCV_1572161 [Trichonephila clavipes]|uniref:Transposase n=1 Tax=Trichonephila clavipes TaxID=2585209 RepID=A0A8X6SQ62_TRICX|nr:hypothetical protein TNCV_1572161 [Trichonephila clavipes]